MKRALSPLTNGVGYTALAGLLLAVAQAAWNAHNQGQPVTWQVIATAAVGVLAGWARGKVTPVADPRDGNGQPLKPLSMTADDMKMVRAVAAWLTGDPPPSGLSASERRRAENLRLMHAPGTPSFYPYPGEPEPAAPPAATEPAP